MPDRLRKSDLFSATLAAAILAWLGLTGFAWSDYDAEASGPVGALVHGHLHTFFGSAPAYGGSLLLRAPFALVPRLWGGGELATYRTLALPCLVAGMLLGMALASQRRAAYPGARWCVLVVALAAGNPITIRALDVGHPEELLGGVLCVAAVLAAFRQRPWLAGLLLGLAIGNKAWAVLAIGPVLLALEDRRGAALAAGLPVAALLVMPFALFATRHGIAGSDVSTIFQPWQVWWPLGDPSAVVHGLDGQLKVGYRGAPAWIGPIPHPLIASLWIPAMALWSARRPPRTASIDVLALLALLMLARCFLDPWNNVYYHLPFLLALLAWEALAFRRPPVATLAATVAVWVCFETLPGRVSPDALFALYLAWALPAAAALGAAVLRVRLPRSSRVASPAAVA